MSTGRKHFCPRRAAQSRPRSSAAADQWQVLHFLDVQPAQEDEDAPAEAPEPPVRLKLKADTRLSVREEWQQGQLTAASLTVTSSSNSLWQARQ